MPFPTGGEGWPPKDMQPAFDLMGVHNAWWVGDPEMLSGIYRRGGWINRPQQFAGGVVGFMSRLWWGRPQGGQFTEQRMHIGLPADIATMSADLKYGDPPRVVMPDSSSVSADGTIVADPEQQALDAVVNIPEFHSALLESGETEAAHGGSYLKLAYDKQVTDRVECHVVSASNAVPEFWGNHLTAVTFWEEYRDDDSAVWRVLERHEPGSIRWGLFEGDDSGLGKPRDLAARPETEWLTRAELDGDGRLSTGVDGLTACYIPNRRPNPPFAGVPSLARFGRSDFWGCESFFDAADETVTSWQRDIRLGKGRIIVPDAWIQSMGFGQGGFFDTEREVYEGLAFTNQDSNEMIKPVQLAIRVAEHDQTLATWIKTAMRTAGYSPSTIGETESGMRTATEVSADERLSERTRRKKLNYTRAALQQFVVTWMQLNATVYGTTPLSDVPDVKFPAEAQQDDAELAQVVQLWSNARAASIFQMVRKLHPDWDGPSVDQEVERIYKDYNLRVATPDGANDRGTNVFGDVMRDLAGAGRAEVEESDDTGGRSDADPGEPAGEPRVGGAETGGTAGS